eukprot:jgi/Orpsp1_1/1187483/evm.model.d7180000058059.1
MELNWCFDFRPNNTLLKELKFRLLDVKNLMELLKVKSTHWYIHVGLTEDLINKSYASSSTHIIDNDNNNIKKKDKKKYLFEKKVNFNNIPVVDFDENKDNSFLWQRIPDTLIEKYENEKNSYLKTDVDEFSKFCSNLCGADVQLIKVNEEKEYSKTVSNPINLSKSANGQYGFVLKAVVNGEINYDCSDTVALFYYNNYVNNTSDFYNENYRLFNFESILKSEFKQNLSIKNTTEYKLNDENSSDFIINILPLDNNKEECKTINYLKSKCKMK